jgi:hypothetical protein
MDLQGHPIPSLSPCMLTHKTKLFSSAFTLPAKPRDDHGELLEFQAIWGFTLVDAGNILSPLARLNW